MKEVLKTKIKNDPSILSELEKFRNASNPDNTISLEKLYFLLKQLEVYVPIEFIQNVDKTNSSNKSKFILIDDPNVIDSNNNLLSKNAKKIIKHINRNYLFQYAKFTETFGFYNYAYPLFSSFEDMEEYFDNEGKIENLNYYEVDENNIATTLRKYISDNNLKISDSKFDQMKNYVNKEFFGGNNKPSIKEKNIIVEKKNYQVKYIIINCIDLFINMNRHANYGFENLNYKIDDAFLFLDAKNKILQFLPTPNTKFYEYYLPKFESNINKEFFKNYLFNIKDIEKTLKNLEMCDVDHELRIVYFNYSNSVSRVNFERKSGFALLSKENKLKLKFEWNVIKKIVELDELLKDYNLQTMKEKILSLFDKHLISLQDNAFENLTKKNSIEMQLLKSQISKCNKEFDKISYIFYEDYDNIPFINISDAFYKLLDVLYNLDWYVLVNNRSSHSFKNFLHLNKFVYKDPLGFFAENNFNLHKVSSLFHYISNINQTMTQKDKDYIFNKMVDKIGDFNLFPNTRLSKVELETIKKAIAFSMISEYDIFEQFTCYVFFSPKDFNSLFKDIVSNKNKKQYSLLKFKGRDLESFKILFNYFKIHYLTLGLSKFPLCHLCFLPFSIDNVIEYFKFKKQNSNITDKK